MIARSALSCLWLSLLVTACPKDGGGTDGDPTTGSATTSGSSTDAPVDTTSPQATDTSGTTTTGTTGVESTGDPGSSSTTGTPAGPYGPCAGPEDCGPDPICVQIFNYCSPGCTVDADCPPPATGDVVPRCTQSSQGSFCRLACPGSAVCPDAMTCIAQQPGPPATCGYP